MKSPWQWLAVAAAFLVASPATAGPVRWYYNPATGGIQLENNLNDPLFTISVISRSSSLTTPSAMLNIAGATKDDSEFPYGLTYLFFPKGRHFVGNVVKPNTFFNDLIVRYRPQGYLGRPITITPEPASLVLGALAGLVLVGTGRRARGRRRVV